MPRTCCNPTGACAAAKASPFCTTVARVTHKGQTTLYRYNRANLVTEEINPLGQSRKTVWSATGLKQSELDARGRGTTWFYSDLGVMTHWRDADGLVYHLKHDEFNRCTQLQAPDKRIWQWRYSAQGSLLEAISPTTREQFDYDLHGCVIAHRHNDAVTRFEYDPWQRPCAQIAPGGAARRWQQTRLGRISTIDDGQGQCTRFDYAEADNAAPRKGLYRAPCKITLPNGDCIRFDWDQEGMLRERIDAGGQSQRYEWGPYDLLLAQIDADGQRHQYRYDDEARLVQITNPLGQHWTWQYDSAGQLLHEQDFAGRDSHYRFDAAGRCTGKIAADGSATEYHYDQRERLHRVQSDDCSITYAYDQFNRMLEARLMRAGELESELSWAWDEAGRVIASVQDDACLAWHFDASGHCTSRSTPLESTHYRHDPAGLLQSLRAGADELHIERDSLGQEIRRTSIAPAAWQAMEQGRADFAPHFHLRQQFDSIGRLLAQSLAFQTPNYAPTLPGQIEARTPLRHYRWQQGRLRGIDDARFGNVSYQLDVRDQIVRADYAGGQMRGNPQPGALHGTNEPLAQETFAYGPTGDITLRDEASAAHMHQPAQAQAQLYERGAVRMRGHLRYRHDACGRMLERTTLQDGFRPRVCHFKWDGFDRLIEVHADDGSLWRYSYDAFGRRTSKRCIRAATGSAHMPLAGQIQEENWLWQGATMAVQSRRYADGRREHLSWHYAPGSFTPLAVSRQINDDASSLLYVVSDHLGTPRELVNANGQVVWAAQLQTWGKLNRCWQQRAANDADQLDIDLRFPNQWHDPESGLHYNYQRYYDPEIGQYCSPDPIGIAGGLRPQGYVHNPGEWCDPLGLSGCPKIIQ